MWLLFAILSIILSILFGGGLFFWLWQQEKSARIYWQTECERWQKRCYAVLHEVDRIRLGSDERRGGDV